MKLNLDTIILFVQNIDRLRNFYANILGLEIVEDDAFTWVLLHAGNANIGLHKMGDQYIGDLTEGYQFDNNTKIVFQIEGDIHHERKMLLDKNVLMKEVKTFDGYGYWLCDGEDPEGNVFQLKQKK